MHVFKNKIVVISILWIITGAVVYSLPTAKTLLDKQHAVTDQHVAVKKLTRIGPHAND